MAAGPAFALAKRRWSGSPTASPAGAGLRGLLGWRADSVFLANRLGYNDIPGILPPRIPGPVTQLADIDAVQFAFAAR